MSASVAMQGSPRPLRAVRRWCSRAVRGFGGAIVAGAIAGLISAGVGSRIVMRIIALTNDDRSGVLTDSSAIVGEMSVGGTLSLLVLGAVFGILGGLLYVALRRWLPLPPPYRGAAFGMLTLVTIGNVLFDTHNVDFQIFEPVLLVIALFASLFVVNGVIVAALGDRIHPEPPHPAGWRAPAAAGAALAIVGIMGLLVLVGSVRTMVDDAGSCYAAVGGGEGCAVLEPDATTTRVSPLTGFDGSSPHRFAGFP